MAKRPTLTEQLAEATARAEKAEKRAAEAEARAPIHADPADRLAPERRGGIFQPILRLPWESMAVVVGVMLVIAAAAYAVGAHESSAFIEGKGAHLGEIIPFGFAGAFVAFVIAWALNRWRWVRERAAPAADDSINALNEWRASCQANPNGGPPSQADATMTLAACVRYAASLFFFAVLTAAGMLLAG